MEELQHCVVLITTSSEQEGKEIARALLEDKLAACVNVVPRVSSFFWWKDEIDAESESLLVVKTRVALLEELEQLVQETHSYDVPEIIALPIVWGSPSYLKWIDDEASGK